ncbi:DUF927 domain-containing protein, partial [Salmonella enterica]|nr:DUF927 domain-containing protein [Salmonella enterica]
MKNAPNLKCLPKDKFTEAIIFAGSEAYAHARGWEESMGKQIAGDTTPPVYLGPKQLAELAGLRIIDKGRRCARVYLSGEIEPIQINAIAEKLAVAGVQEAKLYKGIPDRQPEDWRDYLARLREQAERGETLVDEVNRVRGKRAPEDELAPCVESRAGGLYWVTPKIDKSGVMIRPGEWLSDRMRTVGIGNDGSEAYLVIEMIPEGTEKIIYEAMPRNEIGMPAGWSRLRGRGVAITTSAHLLNKLAEYLQRQGERTVWEVTSTAGWHCGAYVMPDGEVIGVPERPVAFCGGSAAIRGYVVRGNQPDWRENVAALMRGNHSMMLGVLTGLAAPLNSLVGGGCFGIHLFA